MRCRHNMTDHYFGKRIIQTLSSAMQYVQESYSQNTCLRVHVVVHAVNRCVNFRYTDITVITWLLKGDDPNLHRDWSDMCAKNTFLVYSPRLNRHQRSKLLSVNSIPNVQFQESISLTYRGSKWNSPMWVPFRTMEILSSHPEEMINRIIYW